MIYFTEKIPEIKIKCCEDFNKLRNIMYNSPVKVVITADINMNGSEKEFVPIDLSYFKYPLLIRGTKKTREVKPENNNSFKIFNLSVVSGQDNVGLFSNVFEPICIKDIDVENAVMLGKDNVGLFIGCGRDILIDNCNVENAIVSGNNSVGGFIGKSSKVVIKNSYNDSFVEGNEHVGRLIGISYKPKIVSTYSTNSIKLIKQSSTTNTKANVGFSYSLKK